LNFLIDQQLPPAIARFLDSRGHASKHARELGLSEAPDAAIWQHAVQHNMAVISKDEDFYYLAVAPGSTGKLVWIRIGNCRKHTLIQTFETQLDNILKAFDSGCWIVEIR